MNEKFSGSNRSAIQKLNRMRSDIDNMLRSLNTGRILTSRTGGGIASNVSMTQTNPRIPKQRRASVDIRVVQIWGPAKNDEVYICKKGILDDDTWDDSVDTDMPFWKVSVGEPEIEVFNMGAANVSPNLATSHILTAQTMMIAIDIKTTKFGITSTEKNRFVGFAPGYAYGFDGSLDLQLLTWLEGM